LRTLCVLFGTRAFDNSFAIILFRTLSSKHREWVYPSKFAHVFKGFRTLTPLVTIQFVGCAMLPECEKIARHIEYRASLRQGVGEWQAFPGMVQVQQNEGQTL
jgi:hypothetical protein